MSGKHGLKFGGEVIVLSGIVALLAWTFGAGCGGSEKEGESPPKAASHVSTQEGEGVITLDRATQDRSGTAVAPLKPLSHQEEVKAYGTVLPLQDLTDLHNAYAAARAQVEKTRAGFEVSRKTYERLKALHENDQNVSDKALQTAEEAWRSGGAEARAAQDVLRTLEGTARQRWGGVLAGWLMDASPAFDRLVQQHDILVQVTLFSETQIPAAPRTAFVQTSNGAPAPVTLISPSPRTDPRIQGMSFFYLAPAQGTGLLPGMNIIAYLPVGPQVQGVLLPASAVTWWQGKAWVYVQKETGHFVRREVSTESPVQEGWFVSKGLSAGDQLVVSGAQLLLSEEFRSQIQADE